MKKFFALMLLLCFALPSLNGQEARSSLFLIPAISPAVENLTPAMVKTLEASAMTGFSLHFNPTSGSVVTYGDEIGCILTGLPECETLSDLRMNVTIHYYDGSPDYQVYVPFTVVYGVTLAGFVVPPHASPAPNDDTIVVEVCITCKDTDPPVDSCITAYYTCK